jgi:hypothetical protein
VKPGVVLDAPSEREEKKPSWGLRGLFGRGRRTTLLEWVVFSGTDRVMSRLVEVFDEIRDRIVQQRAERERTMLLVVTNFGEKEHITFMLLTLVS